MANELSKADSIQKLDAIVKQYNFDVIEANEGAFSKALVLAKGIQELRKAFTPEVLRDFQALQGSSIGFRTDRDGKGGYGVDEIRDCAIEALLRGAYPVGNEFNIIASRAYFTKEYFERRLREYPGFTDFVFIPDVPKTFAAGAIVHCKGSWKLNGVPMEAEEDIPVRTNQGMIVDAILGKAKRKFCARVLARISGSAHSIPDDDSMGAIDADATVIDTQQPVTQSDKLKSDMKARQKRDAANGDSDSTTQSEGQDDASPTGDDFARAHAKLSLLYDDHGDEIDRLLRLNGVDSIFIDIPKTCGDKKIAAEVIRIANGFGGGRDS